ncbi:helix-turn-helix domain-containing protein [Fulvivirgaceae bacterium BMA12]|uniref:Helix-turn-helix domain-containing protein n=1 Tax=Agaribacillus aureus TaxID=3051825 RepID=A0ABT8L4K9_9BACT|nr:helix-turn-helix domain-containing protein [Fulvivirgaceae bacterium BMA12]
MRMDPKQRCAVIETLKVFSAKWKPCILSYLFTESKRYGELQRLIPNISRKMLTQHLKELCADGLIERKPFPTIPPKVEYVISEKGKSLQPVFRVLNTWGVNNLDNVCSTEEMIAT